MENTRINYEQVQVENKIIENAKLLQCFFCQIKELPNFKKGKKFIKICELCQKKLEMLNEYARPWEEVVN